KRPAVTVVRWARERSTQLASRLRSTARSVAHRNRPRQAPSTMPEPGFRNFQVRAATIWPLASSPAWDNPRSSPEGAEGFRTRNGTSDSSDVSAHRAGGPDPHRGGRHGAGRRARRPVPPPRVRDRGGAQPHGGGATGRGGRP